MAIKSALLITLRTALMTTCLSFYTATANATEEESIETKLEEIEVQKAEQTDDKKIEETKDKKAEQTVDKKLKEIDKKRLQFENELKIKQDQIGEIDQQEQTIRNEIKKLDGDVAIINEKIRNLEPIINTTKEEIDRMESEIASLSERIEKRDKVIRQRFRSKQVQGGEIPYLNVFLGVKSFAEFLETSGVVTTIIGADKKILEDHISDQEVKKRKERELRDRLTALDENMRNEETLKVELQGKIVEKNNIMNSLQESKVQIESEILDLYEVHDILTSQEIAIIKEYELKKNEIANLELDDIFTKPSTGVVTSGYGPRWETSHKGIDIADPSPNTIVVAAASGTVIRSYYSFSYGNCVFITHNFQGKTYTTVYAHLENRLVENGDSVSKGQLLGFMGSTGHSTGKHLHFEIHEGPWNLNKTYSVDPALYVNF